jgi:hypothetical protein
MRHPGEGMEKTKAAGLRETGPERPSGIGREPRPVLADDDPELGATTAEYGIVMLAAVGFAGLLVVILRSTEVREMLLGMIRTALSAG